MCANMYKMTFRREIKEYVDVPLTHQLVSDVLADYQRPNDKISELIKNGSLISLRRGLYIPGPESDLPIPHLFVIANHLRGPSYVSLESALSYWGMIPERVHEITSVTIKTSYTYDTPVGRFQYRHLASPYYSFGIRREKVAENQYVMIASREKALCDQIVQTPGVILRSRIQTLDFLLEDMRMDEEDLSELDIQSIESWLPDAPKRSSLQTLIKTLQSL